MHQDLPSSGLASPPWYARWNAAALLLLAVTILPYLNTFTVPFYFDDTNNIVDNPLIRDLPRAVQSLLEGRGLALFTFALNYRFGGLEVFGYHVVNLAIHAGCVMLVWALLRRILDSASPWPLIGALLFAVHPVQTQAVTYIVQRMSSLAALFFFAAILCHLTFFAASGRQRWLYYFLALLLGTLAVLTKENTAVLPVILLLLERTFRPGRSWRRQLSELWPFCIVPLLLAAFRLGILGGGELANASRYTNQLLNLQNNTPLNYLFTEFSVLWHYIRLLFVPVGQVFDYGWPVADRLLTGRNVVAGLGLAAIGWAAWKLRHRSPLFSFGIAWFFVTLSVESSIIPLDPIFEHRLYLPLFGFVLVFIALLGEVRSLCWRTSLVGLILLILAVLTWQRNDLWKDQVAFLEDNLRHAPNNERVMAMLGNAYVAAGRSEDGLQMLRRARRVNPGYDRVYTAEAKVLIDRGEGELAIPLLEEGLKHNPQYAVLYEYLGIAYGQTDNFDLSIRMLQRALQLSPEDASVLMNLGVAYAWMGDDERATGYYRRSLEIVPDSEKTLFNYAVSTFRLGDEVLSLELLRKTVRVNPDNADAQYGRGSMALAAGNRQEALAARDALLRLGDEERVRELDEMLSGKR